jgi:hypothetical protein
MELCSWSSLSDSADETLGSAKAHNYWGAGTNKGVCVCVCFFKNNNNNNNNNF